MFQSLKNQLRKINVVVKIYELWVYRNRKIFSENLMELSEKQGVEIGGPSQIFSEAGPLPVYGIIKSLDNVNFSDKTFWSNIDEGYNFSFSSKKGKGKQIIADAIDLSVIDDKSYDFLLSSHVIEHIANPIKAVMEWKRVVKTNGIMVVVAPDRRKTYDRKRPLTDLDHIIKDYIEKTEENDTTHFEEVIKLHDLSVDNTVKDLNAHIERTNLNFEKRIVHHHTFDSLLLSNVLKYCGLEILDSQVFKPYHVVVVARKTDK